MIRDEIVYGIGILALLLFAFYIMPRYEHMTNGSTVSKLEKELSELEQLHDPKHILTSADTASVKALIAKLKSDQASGKPLDKKIVEQAQKEIDSFIDLVVKSGFVKPDAAAKSPLQYTNLTLPGAPDDYPSGPSGPMSADKYVLKSSLVPGCQGGKGCIGGGGRNGLPTSVVPGDQDGAYADMSMISPNQYNLMNPDAWQTGGEEPKPFLTSFASFMK